MPVRILALAMTAVSVSLFGVAAQAAGIEDVAYLVGWLAFALIGAFLASRRPRNAIGWLFAILGLASLIAFVAEEQRGMAEALLPDRVVAAFAAFWFVSFDLLPALLILFPDGRPPSRRWWLAIAAIVVALPVGVLSSAEHPGDAAIAPALITLFGEEAGLAAIEEMQGIALLEVPMLFLGVLALALRTRRADRVERQQLKWFTYAAGLLALVFAATYVAFLSPLSALDPEARFPVAMFGGVPFVAGLVSIPAAATVAILRYRLYDIDVLINRTIVYAGLTAVLGAVYVASVIATQALLVPLTGGSEIAVAASTLLVIALFQPVRRGIQRAVDRRFYRSRYDAQRTLDAFSGRLRDEVDLDDVRTHLLAAVNATMEPRGASVWLRKRS